MASVAQSSPLIPHRADQAPTAASTSAATHQHQPQRADDVVNRHKYDGLKRKYAEIKESRDENMLALERAQKLIGRLREENSALLERLSGPSSSQPSGNLPPRILDADSGNHSDHSDLDGEGYDHLSGAGGSGPRARGQTRNGGPLPSNPTAPYPGSSGLPNLLNPLPEGHPDRAPPRKKSKHLRDEARNDEAFEEAVRLGMVQEAPVEPSSGKGKGGSEAANGTADETGSPFSDSRYSSALVASILNFSRDRLRIRRRRQRLARRMEKKFVDQVGGGQMETDDADGEVDEDLWEGASDDGGLLEKPLPELDPYFNDNGDLITTEALAARLQQKKIIAGLTVGNTIAGKNGGGSVAGDFDDGASAADISVSQEKTMKPKRTKAHNVVTKTVTVPKVARYSDGSPKLPLQCGMATLVKLGTIHQGQHFSTERYIFPIGYEVIRSYNSMLDKDKMTTYTCRILDGGDSSPRFEIEPKDDPEHKIIAGTATGAWAQIVKTANRLRERNHSNSVSGPDYYGLGHNTVKLLIQELDGARELNDYVWQNFVEVQPAVSKKERLRVEKAEKAQAREDAARSKSAASGGRKSRTADDASYAPGGGGMKTSRAAVNRRSGPARKARASAASLPAQDDASSVADSAADLEVDGDEEDLEDEGYDEDEEMADVQQAGGTDAAKKDDGGVFAVDPALAGA